jgi:hypothetical protein
VVPKNSRPASSARLATSANARVHRTISHAPTYARPGGRNAVTGLNVHTLGGQEPVPPPCGGTGLGNPGELVARSRGRPGPRLSCRSTKGMAHVADPERLSGLVMVALPAEIDMANAESVGELPATEPSGLARAEASGETRMSGS